MSTEEFPDDKSAEVTIDDEVAAKLQDRMIQSYFAISAAAAGAALLFADKGVVPQDFMNSGYINQIRVLASIGLIGGGVLTDGIHNHLPSKTMAIVGGALIGYGIRTEQTHITLAGLCIAGTGVMSYLYLERQRLLTQNS